MEIPDEAPEEATPTEALPPPEDTDDLFGDGVAEDTVERDESPPDAGLPKETAPPDPIDTLEDIVAPRPAPTNVAPAYPEDMRKKGIEAQVILKLTISETGVVIDVKVLKGDEPFLGAALAVVKGWQYTPGLVDGKPAVTTQIVRIPFRIRS
jgi:protein TonB